MIGLTGFGDRHDRTTQKTPKGNVIGNENATKSLEKELGVNRLGDEAQGASARAAFAKSNVTFNERAIQGHATPYGRYWLSDDFNPKLGKQNITFENPLEYKPAGGEFIYSLPNGLHGYLVTNNEGKRLDGAPLDVVKDPFRAHRDSVVLNGMSCMNCHQYGIKPGDDEVRFNFEELAKSLKNIPDAKLEETIERVNRIYPGKDKVNALLATDAAAYKAALEKTGNSVDKRDPVFATSEQFDAPIDLRTMAAELGHDETKVAELIESDPALRSRLGYGKQHTSERDAFNANFGELRNRLEGKPAGVRADFADKNFDKHFEFVNIGPGEFLMGSAPNKEPERDGDETQHKVQITKPYAIGKFEVTQGLWEKVMGGNPSKFKGANRPVETVSWKDITDKPNGFLSRLNSLRKSQGDPCTYRLPTEAEWEFAARSGTDTKYSFGNNENELDNFAWFTNNSGEQTHDVDDATKIANPKGIQGIHGNVYEWCQDTYQANLEASLQTDPKIGVDNDDGSLRVMRGGGWISSAQDLRSANRGGDSVDDRVNVVGFRLVRQCR